MNWNQHSDLIGKHALFNPSGVSWLNYKTDEDSVSLIFQRYKAQYATTIGTALHEYAEKRIKYRLKMYKTDKNSVLMHLLDKGIPLSVIDLDYIYDNLMLYVNDSVGFQMDPEVILYYSENCFGTADSICYRKNNLRIHDYKSGRSVTHIEQTEIYAGLFCLEYGIKPEETTFNLRIYRADELVEEEPEPEVIRGIMNQIITLDSIVSKWKAEDRIV